MIIIDKTIFDKIPALNSGVAYFIVNDDTAVLYIKSGILDFIFKGACSGTNDSQIKLPVDKLREISKWKSKTISLYVYEDNYEIKGERRNQYFEVEHKKIQESIIPPKLETEIQYIKLPADFTLTTLPKVNNTELQYPIYCNISSESNQATISQTNFNIILQEQYKTNNSNKLTINIRMSELGVLRNLLSRILNFGRGNNYYWIIFNNGCCRIPIESLDYPSIPAITFNKDNAIYFKTEPIIKELELLSRNPSTKYIRVNVTDECVVFETLKEKKQISIINTITDKIKYSQTIEINNWGTNRNFNFTVDTQLLLIGIKYLNYWYCGIEVVENKIILSIQHNNKFCLIGQYTEEN